MNAADPSLITSPSVDAILAEMVARTLKLAPQEGMSKTAFGPLQIYRANRTSEAIHGRYEPALCIIAQGCKRAMLGDEIYNYSPRHYLVAAVDLPVVGQVVEASEDKPYLCVRLELTPQKISDLLIETTPKNTSPQTSHDKLSRAVRSQRGLFVSQANGHLLDAVLRLLRLLDNPADLPILAPLFEREILYRLLQDDQADALHQIALADSHAQKIAAVIALLKRDFQKSWRIEELAQTACMSNSSLHTHFKNVTNMTPLQYQKNLRLQEARRLLFVENLDAATASHRVGYESPSQFNREYHRLFGLPPVRDLAQLRATKQLMANA
jgi:AraC-like DNA-binding protein